MAATNLGSLTLNVVADLGQYTVPLEKAERLTQKAMRAMGIAVDDFGNYTDKAMKKAAESTKVLDSQFDRMADNMRREIELYGEVSRAATLRYDLEKGALQNLSVEQKKSLSEMAVRLDAMDDANAAFKANAMAVNQATGSMRGFRGVATGLGYQLQDIAVQAQMGTSAFMILGQQGSQIASLFGPTGAIVGAVIAVGGAIAGALLPSLFKTSSAAEDVADDVAALVTELNNLDAVQQKLVLTANKYSIDDQTKAYEEQGKRVEEIRKEIQRLNEENGKMQYVRAGSGGVLSGSGSGMMVFVDNTLKLRDATRELNSVEIARVATLKEIEKLQDPTGGRQEIINLNKELELIGLTGEALHQKMADQKGYTDGLKTEYVALSLLIEQREEEADLAEKAAKDAEDAAKKAKEAEKTRAEGIQKLITAMEREADLFGVTSRVAQTEYDILKKIIEVQGGLEGIEARRLLLGAERLDQLEREARLNDVLNIEIDQRVQDQIEADKKAGKANEKALKDTQKQYEQFFERIDQVGVDVWEGMIEGSTSAFDAIKKLFISTLAEMAHAAVTRPLILQLQQQFMPAAAQGAQAAAGQANQAGSAIAAGGVYAAIAVAVVAGVNIWNKAQDEKFKELTAEFRQGNQSTGTLLGMANAKSDSISQALTGLGDLSADTLNVNRGMYDSLRSIDQGINNVAAGFARQLGVTGGVGVSGIQTGSSTLDYRKMQVDPAGPLTGSLLDNSIGDFIEGFSDGINKKVTEALYSKKKKIIDSGVQFVGQSLADILAEGTVEAFAYADVQTKKKTLGVTTSNKVKTQTEALDDLLLTQFASVFEGAGAALSEAAGVFGLDFQNYINKLVVDPQKLSLKGLEGEALTKEIESFFSSTLDNWAGVLVDGSTVLQEFQGIGEGAFETVIRLASQLNTFNRYADALNLNFEVFGFSAVEASQAIAEAAGGFDKLSASLSGYYNNFFTEQERAAAQMDLLSAEFKKIGIDAVPSTREAFRSLIESIDLTTAAGQEQFAALISLQGAFAELVPVTKELASAAMSAADIMKQRAELEHRLWLLTATTNDLREKELASIHESNRSILEQIFATEDLLAAEKALAEKRADIASEIASLEEQYFQQTATVAQKRAKVLSELLSEEARLIQRQLYALEDAQEAFAQLISSVSDQKKKLDDANSVAVKAITESLGKHRQLADALRGALGSMTLESEKYTEATRKQAQAQIIAANAIVRAGGPLPEVESLSAALAAVRQPSTQMFSNFEDYARDFYTTQRNLAELEAAAGAQVSIDEQNLIDQENYHKLEIEKLDKMLEFYQAQLDALGGVDRSVLTVAEALYNLNSVLQGTQSPTMAVAFTSTPTTTTVAAEKYGTMSVPSVEKSFSDILSELRGLRGDLEVSQYHIAKNTQQSTTMLQRWETDGIPPERAEL